MKIDKGIRTGIISSLIATVAFLYLLEPIGGTIGKWFLSIGRFGLQSYIDRIYREVATQDYDLPFMILYVTLLFILVGSFFKIFTKVAEIVKRPEEESEEEKSTLNKDDKKKDRRFKWLEIISPIILFIAFLMIFIDASIKKKAISSFNQHIKVVTPFITEGEKNIIVSDFSRMDSQEDYKKIQEELQRIASDHEIVLPENYQYIW